MMEESKALVPENNEWENQTMDKLIELLLILTFKKSSRSVKKSSE